MVKACDAETEELWETRVKNDFSSARNMVVAPLDQGNICVTWDSFAVNLMWMLV